jgi:uncharacterized protein (UPF0248 family)
VHARIYTDTPQDFATVEVTKVVSAGILTNNNAGDEIDEKLIPWHRVLEVSSKVEGELFLETGR